MHDVIRSDCRFSTQSCSCVVDQTCLLTILVSKSWTRHALTSSTADLHVDRHSPVSSDSEKESEKKVSN